MNTSNLHPKPHPNNHLHHTHTRVFRSFSRRQKRPSSALSIAPEQPPAPVQHKNLESKLNHLQKNCQLHKQRIEQLTKENELLKKEITTQLRKESKNSEATRSSVEVYEKEKEKGELTLMKRQNRHLQLAVADYRKEVKDVKARNQQLLEIVKRQEELIGKLKHNLMIAVQSNPNELQLLSYNIRIPKLQEE